MEPGDIPELPPTGMPDYDALPRAIREQHPPEGWLWLTDAEKARLQQTETEPEF